MTAATNRCMGHVGALVVIFAASMAHGLDQVEFVVASADPGLTKSLESASVVMGLESGNRADPQDILAAGRAEYAALLNALYARGHYSAVIHVTADGREVADLPPLDTPARVGRLRVTVDPGPQFVLSRATVRPLPYRPEFPQGFRAGEIAESGVIIGAATAAVDGWRAQGNAKARVFSQDIVADHARATLAADIQIAPGPVLRFGRLRIEGEKRMRERRIEKIAGLPEGEIFDPKDLDRAAARLRRTGVFKSVALIEDDGITAPDLLGITAVVVEQKPRRYAFGAEVASEDGLTLSANWLHRNLLGGGERLELGAEVTNIASGSSGVDYLLSAQIDRPATFTPDTNLGFGVEIGRLDEADYNADLASATVLLTHIFSDSLTGRAGVSYSHAAITDQVGSFTYRSLALPLGLTWDRRDSSTDAKRGFYIDAEVKPFQGFGITDNGVRAKLDLRGYKSLGAEQRLVLAARVQLGAIYGASLLGAPRDDLFYSGGAGTVRGQPFQSLGVPLLRGAIPTTIGATHFIGTSVEARYAATESLGVVGFVDVGRIDVTDFFSGTGAWHAGAGMGVRYATGVGPLRLDVAAPIGGNTGDGVQIYLGLGQSF